MTRREFGHLTPAQMKKLETQHHSGWNHEQLAEHWGLSLDIIQHVLEHRAAKSPVAFTWKATP
jgi:hypothetical protein